MMRKRAKALVISLVAIVLSIAGSSMTLAYFSSTSESVSYFVVGHASANIEVYRDKDNLLTSDYYNESNLIVGGTKIGFMLRATNNGNIPVYQRFRIVIPAALKDKMELKLYDGGVCGDLKSSSSYCQYGSYVARYVANGEGKDAEYQIIKTALLDVNQSTSEVGRTDTTWPTRQLEIKEGATWEEFLQYATCDASDIGKNSCVLGITVKSEAIQADGFTSAAIAFREFDR